MRRPACGAYGPAADCATVTRMPDWCIATAAVRSAANEALQRDPFGRAVAKQRVAAMRDRTPFGDH